MASSFPGAIDNFTDPLANSSLASPSHAGQHSDLNDAVEKIETYMGLVKVIPTSVSSAGGTAATLSADGTVTIGNGNTTVSLNGCFSSLYSYYVINAKMAFSTTTNAIFRLRSVGTDNATAWYGSVSRTQANSASATITNYNGNLSWVVTDNQSSTTYLNLTVYDPFAASTTMTTMTGTGVGTTSFQYTGGSYHGLSVSYDGFSLFPSTGTHTGGTIRVYGYRN